MSDAPFIAGVIEGFYGPPWSHEDRLRCIDLIASCGGNAYVWAAKLEPRHRELWAEPFTSEEIAQFSELASRHTSVGLSIGLTPGKDATTQQVVDKLSPAISAGATSITLCFDDLPVLDAGARQRDLCNELVAAFNLPVWLVPTHYAGMNNSPYLEQLCNGLSDKVLVMWTGSHVVTDTITAAHAVARTTVMNGRTPLLWDNTPVNDAMMADALHMGPYQGRDPELREHLAGVLLNPSQFEKISEPTIVSGLAWVRGEDHIAAWEECVDSRGWRARAEATAYPGDHHWPGSNPPREWWNSVATMDPQGIDLGVDVWVDHAVAGAALAMDALSVTGNPPADPQRRTFFMMGIARRWATWRRSHALTFGAGPRIRPVVTNDTQGRFVLGDTVDGAVQANEDLVSAVVRSQLGITRD